MDSCYGPRTDQRERPIPTDSKQLQQITQLIKKIEKIENVDYSVAKTVTSDLNSFLESCGFKGVKAKCYGSYMSSLALRTSNINISLDSGNHARKHILKEIYKFLMKEFTDYHITFEEKTMGQKSKICLTEPTHGIVCEIVRKSERTSPEFACLLMSLCDYDIRVRPLFIAIRVWAEACNIHEVESGRLHPLCYILMCIHFLQCCFPPVLPKIDINHRLARLKRVNESSIGKLWLQLLKYYSEYDWTANWISITKGDDVNIKKFDLAFHKEYDRPGGHAVMTIEDPYLKDRNLAKSLISEGIKHFIQGCFKNTYEYFSKYPDSDSDVSSFKNGSDIKKFNYSFDVYIFTKNLELVDVSTCSDCDDLGTTCKECKSLSPTLRVDPLTSSIGIDSRSSMKEENSSMAENVRQTPAQPYQLRRGAHFLGIISRALDDTYKKNQLTVDDEEERKTFVENMEKLVKLKFHRAKLELMGSSANGFGFKDSDLDICMTFEGVSQESIGNVEQILRGLCSYLRRNSYSAFFLGNAKIPIVKFEQHCSSFKGDISLYNILSLYNTRLLRTYSLIDERVKILGCAMKLLAKSGSIADSANKTLSSYSYIIMVIHFLQQTNPPVLPVLQEMYDVTEGITDELKSGCNVRFYEDVEYVKSVLGCRCRKSTECKVNKRIPGIRWEVRKKRTESGDNALNTADAKNSRCKENKNIVGLSCRGKNDSIVGKLWLDFIFYYLQKFNQEKFVVISIRKKRLLNENEHDLKRHSSLLNIEDPFILKKNLGAIVSEKMGAATRSAFHRARDLFNNPRVDVPDGFNDWSEFFFHPSNLTGTIPFYPSENKTPQSAGAEPKRFSLPRYVSQRPPPRYSPANHNYSG